MFLYNIQICLSKYTHSHAGHDHGHLETHSALMTQGPATCCGDIR
jgi:hypothetical protein